jgi:ketosteroid isomerase-like protein
MSQENVEVVRRLFEAQGTPGFLKLLDPHVVWLNHASAPETRPYVGHEGVVQWYAGFQRHIGDMRFDPIELIDAGGDQVVSVHRVVAIGQASGAAVEQTAASVITLLNKRIVRVQGFETRARALEAAGLSE